MDAFQLIPSEMARSDPYWVGKMSATIGESLNCSPNEARRQLRGCLAEFIASPVPSEELREILRIYLR